MTDKMMHEALQAAISLYGGNTALGRLVRERGAVGVFEIAFEYGWRALKPKVQEGDAPKSITGTQFTITGEASDKIWELMGRDGAAWVRIERDNLHVYRAAEVVFFMPKDENAEPEAESIVKPRNPREPESTDPVIGWLKEIGDKLYHSITRQEEIGIVQCRMMNEVLDLMQPKDEENGCSDEGAKIRADLDTTKKLEEFWRNAASTMGEANIAQRERIMKMGDLIDGLTNRR